MVFLSKFNDRDASRENLKLQMSLLPSFHLGSDLLLELLCPCWAPLTVYILINT